MTKPANAIWKLLWPYIASEDPPDSGDSEKDLLHLMESVLPNVWNEVGKFEAVVEAAKELNEVAYHRGDNQLPHPEDDPKLWTARMQTAWDELERTLTDLENLTIPAK